MKANAKFDFGATRRCPTIRTQKGAPQNSIIGGASLWVMGGKKPEEYKGVAKFFTFLSDTDRQVGVHKASGYLPITKAAYAKTKESGYYKENPYLETPLLELTNKEPTENSRGLRLGNMVQLRDVWAEEIEAALAGKKSAKEALDAAVVARQHDAAAVRADGDAVGSQHTGCRPGSREAAIRDPQIPECASMLRPGYMASRLSLRSAGMTG